MHVGNEITKSDSQIFQGGNEDVTEADDLIGAKGLDGQRGDARIDVRFRAGCA